MNNNPDMIPILEVWEKGNPEPKIYRRDNMERIYPNGYGPSPIYDVLPFVTERIEMPVEEIKKRWGITDKVIEESTMFTDGSSRLWMFSEPATQQIEVSHIPSLDDWSAKSFYCPYWLAVLLFKVVKWLKMKGILKG